VVERSGIPQVAIFLALGAALGPTGLGALDVGLGSPALQVVAALSLARIHTAIHRGRRSSSRARR
jgi:hypothetical protein